MGFGADLTLFEASDDDLRNALKSAELPTLLPSLAYITGDLSLLDPDLRPPIVPVAIGRPAQGGLSAEQQEGIRELALQVLQKLRGDGFIPTPEGDERSVLAIMEYLTGDIPEDYAALLKSELGLPQQKVIKPVLQEKAKESFNLIIIGAGMSGLAAAYTFAQAGISFTVLEKNPDVGGTWLENHYPGCRLDTGNFAYSYSFAQKNDWPTEYTERDEVLRYFQEFSKRTSLRDSIRFGTEVISARWDETASRWDIQVKDDQGIITTYNANFIISAVGQLNRPKIPQIQGQELFQGAWMHTANWNSDLDLEGKRVAVIGTGSSAYQVIPSIYSQVKELFVFQRSAPWLLPTPNYHDPIPDGQKWLFRVIPEYHRWFRFYQFWTNIKGRYRYSKVDPNWDRFANGSVSEANDSLRKVLTEYLETQFSGRPDLLKKVIPKYPPYSKRMLRDNGAWAKALTSPNVTLATDPIERLTEGGIATQDGQEYPADVIIYATGFNASDFLQPMQIFGMSGVELHDFWQGDARAYLGILIPNFPNFFCLYGPNTNFLTNGSITVASESAVNFALECIRLVIEGGHKALQCRFDVFQEFNREIDAANQQMAWGIPEVKSWYKNQFGRVSQNWPLPLLEYWARTRVANPDDFEIW